MTGFSNRLRDDALTIYLLHGVIPERATGVRNYTVKHLGLARFQALCAELASSGTSIGIEDAVAALQGSAPLPPRAFLLSFDDGFANNLRVAAPVMEHHGIHSIFYLTTSFVGEQGASWIDLVEEAVEHTSRTRLRLPWESADRPAGTRAEKIAFLDEVRRVVKAGDGGDPYDAAASIRAAADAGDFVPDEDLDRKLTWDEARELAGHPLFEVGGHSHTHRILSHLSRQELAEELDTSIATLQRELGAPVRHYSYPEGLPHCYSPAVIDALRDRGVVCCPTAEDGVNHVGDDLFRLRRVWVL